jgi:hypothetical protein
LSARIVPWTVPAAPPDNPVHAQIARMEGELAGLREALAEARARASEESAKTAQAIAAFEAIARRLEAMAEAKRPSWWRWLRFAD